MWRASSARSSPKVTRRPAVLANLLESPRKTEPLLRVDLFGLRRFFADAPWHHISVRFNYQPHHVRHALDYYLLNIARLHTTLPMRLQIRPEDICNVHFSGMKPWDQFVPKATNEHPDEFLDRLFKSNFPHYNTYTNNGYLLEHENHVQLDDNRPQEVVDLAKTRLRQVLSTAETTWRQCLGRMLLALDQTKPATSPAHPRSSHPAQSLHQIQEQRQAPDGNYYTAGQFLEHYRQYKEWDSALPQHPPLTTQPTDSHNSETKPTQAQKTGVDTTHSLFHTLAHPSSPADTRWHIGQRLLVRWGPTSTLCTVRSIHADGRYVVQYDQGGSWGDTERRVPSARLHKPPPTCEVL